MVDQVEVTNVGADGGSNGIASEVTLERLAATMERMSKQQGADGAATVKKLKQLNQELENGINGSTQYQDAISENTDQVEENTEAVEESTDAHRTLADTMLGVFMGALGTVAGSLKGLTSELVFGGDQVSDFAQHMPMIGELLKPVAGYLDDTMDTFRELRTIGGSLGNDLMEFRRSTAEMYLSMDEFTSFMKDNSESIAAYGGTVTGGIRELRLMNSALGEHREDLLNMGFTFEDMNDALSHYMYLNRTGQMIERRSRDEQAAAAAEYAKNLDRLSKLTGQDVDAMRQRLVEEQNNIAVQRELAKMSDEQRDTWNEAYASMSTFSNSAGVPAGVFSILTCNEKEIGIEFTSNPTVRKMSFTGSTEVGRLLYAQSAPTIKKISLELGGNAPFIVFEDADLDAAVQGAIASKYRNTGQTCVCTNRFYIHEAVYDEFASRLAKAVAELKVGNGMDDGVTQGPLIDQDALAKVQAHVADAVAKGGKVLTGGKQHALGGTYYEPTIITGVTTDMKVSTEETFGPLAPLFKFKDETDVIQMANNTEYGLAAYFYSRDISRVWRVAEALEYGMVGINVGIISNPAAPFGGVKQSGLGREGSNYGLDDYMVTKYMLMAV